jgi:hypothetical protein
MLNRAATPGAVAGAVTARHVMREQSSDSSHAAISGCVDERAYAAAVKGLEGAIVVHS